MTASMDGPCNQYDSRERQPYLQVLQVPQPLRGTPDDDDNWSATRQVFARPELCALIAEHSDLVGAQRLKGVCRAMRTGAGELLRTLPGLVVCGGDTRGGGRTSEVWRLDLGKLQWERMPRRSLTRGLYGHACCVVRGRFVVLGGLGAFETGGYGDRKIHLRKTSNVEILGGDDSEETWKALPPLSCGPISHCHAFAIDESESELGQVLLFGPVSGSSSAVHRVDLATGVCTPQPSSFNHRHSIVAARMPDRRIVFGSGENPQHTVKVLGPPDPGSPNGASWQWRDLPGMSVERRYYCACVMSDGRFAVFGGWDKICHPLSSCEALSLVGPDARWDPLPPMRQARGQSACAAIGGCVIVFGGMGSVAVDVYEEGLRRWRRLPCNLPDSAGTRYVGSAVL
jgi:hypothetical protein